MLRMSKKSQMKNRLWFLYVLKRYDNGLYVGISTKPEIRIKQHIYHTYNGKNGCLFFENISVSNVLLIAPIGLMNYNQAEEFETYVTEKLHKEYLGIKIAGGSHMNEWT